MGMKVIRQVRTHGIGAESVKSWVKSMYRNAILLMGLVAISLAYTQNYVFDHQEDLKIFLEAGRALEGNTSPYSGTEYRYVYGPYLAIFLSFLTHIEYEVIQIFWFFLNLISVIGIVYSINRLRKSFGIQNVDSIFLAIVIISSFTFRNSIAQGQIVSLLALLSLQAILLSMVSILPNFRALIIALLLLPLVETKPYLAIGVLIFFLIKRQYRILIWLPITLMFANVIYFWMFRVSYIDWYRALNVRVQDVNGGYDQASLQGVLDNTLNLSEEARIVLAALWLIGLGIWILLQRKTLFSAEERLICLALVLPSLASPFLHSHDILFPLLGLILMFRVEVFNGSIKKCLLLILILLHLNWTSENVLGGILMQTVILIAMYCRESNRTKLKNILILGASMFTFTLFLHFLYPINDYARIYAYNARSFFFAIVIFLILILKDELQKPKAK